MAKKKDLKPIPIAVGIIMILIALVSMGLLLWYIIAPPEAEVPHVDNLGVQSFEEETSVTAPAPVEVKEYMSDANVGDAVYYGKYEQDGNSENGTEPIQWVVLEKDETGLLLISRYCLDAKPYNDSRENVNWQTSSLRAWLNDGFFKSAFDEIEQSNLIGMGEFVSENPLIDSSVDFVDNVSIFFEDMAAKYEKWLPTSATEYAVANGVETKNGNSWWWVRENPTKSYPKSALSKYVYFDGRIMEQGFAVDYKAMGVRPVIRVNINAEKEDYSSSEVESQWASEDVSEESALSE